MDARLGTKSRRAGWQLGNVQDSEALWDHDSAIGQERRVKQVNQIPKTINRSKLKFYLFEFSMI
jgi:hypothetical protein